MYKKYQRAGKKVTVIIGSLYYTKYDANLCHYVIVYMYLTVRSRCSKVKDSLVSQGCRIHQLHLCGGVSLSPMSALYDSEGSVMLELWGMRSTPSLPSLPGPIWPRVVAPERVLSMGQIELDCVITLN